MSEKAEWVEIVMGDGAHPIVTRMAQLAGVKNPKKFKKFNERMTAAIMDAHLDAGDNTKAAKQARQLRCRLVKPLRDKDLWRALDVDTSVRRPYLYALNDLLNHLRDLEALERLKDHRPKHWNTVMRKRFVNDLLNAADKAGGKLVVDLRNNGGGSLVEAVALLQPHLPDVFRHGLGEETLRKLKRAWVKNRKK